MKLNKLLLAASAIAMTATSASALDIIVTNPTTPVTPALELQFPQPPGSDVALSFEVNTNLVTADAMGNPVITPGGDFPAGNNLLVDVNLPSGTSFADLVTGDIVTSPDGTVSAVVQGMTGQAGSNAVTLLVSIPQGASIDQLQFDVNVNLDECPTATSDLVVEVTTEQGTDIQEGVVRSDSFVTLCRSAVDIAVFDDNAAFFDNDNDPNTPPVALAFDTEIKLPDYDVLGIDFDQPGSGTTDPSVVGYLFATIDPSVSRNISGDPVDVTDVSRVGFNVVIESTSGLDSIEVGGQTVNIVDDQLVYEFVFNGGAEDALFGTPVPIRVFETGTEVIETQQLRVEGLVATFVDTNANFIPQERYDDGDIDFLQREGQTFGFFDWNSGPDGAQTNSIYRITGLSQVEDTPYTITLTNASPASAEGTYRAVVPAAAAAATNGEAVLNSIGKWGIPSIPNFVRADALVNFESSADIDVDRLLVRNGIISDFGDGSNQSDFGGQHPNRDSDDFSGNE